MKVGGRLARRVHVVQDKPAGSTTDLIIMSHVLPVTVTLSSWKITRIDIIPLRTWLLIVDLLAIIPIMLFAPGIFYLCHTTL